MRILFGCEKSGVGRRAMRARGAEAWSCDLLPADDRDPHHVTGDVFAAIAAGCPADGRPWDLVVAHPPCTYLCNSGALRLYLGGKKRNGRDPARWEQMKEAARFFRRFFIEYTGKLCAENPVMHGHAFQLIEYSREMYEHGPVVRQTVQPFQFGEDASKATVLWLRGLPMLSIDPARYVKPRMVCPRCSWRGSYDDAFHGGCPEHGAAGLLPRWANQTDSGQNRLPPSATRAAERAETYPGIAAAMAIAWLPVR